MLVYGSNWVDIKEIEKADDVLDEVGARKH
jgi:hypothetical protein